MKTLFKTMLLFLEVCLFLVAVTACQPQLPAAINLLGVLLIVLGTFGIVGLWNRFESE